MCVCVHVLSYCINMWRVLFVVWNSDCEGEGEGGGMMCVCAFNVDDVSQDTKKEIYKCPMDIATLWWLNLIVYT